MWLAQSLLLLVAPLFVAADGSATLTSTAPAATRSIQVGAVGFSFTPSSITAIVGDIIEFRFYPQNHSVARADFQNPCIPYEDTGPGRVGFYSGFKPIAVVLSNPPTFQVVVNDTNPIFFYCAAPGACMGEGMVGVINPNATETFAIQQASALNSTTSFAPGQYFPAEVAPGGSSTTLPTPSSTATVTPVANASRSGSSLSVGAIVGIVIGALAVLIVFAALIYVCGRQKTMGEMLRHSQFGSLHYGGQTPVTPSTGFFPRSPHLETDALGRRFSQASPHDRTAFVPEFQRARSPTVNEARENGLVNGSPVGSSKAASLSPNESPLMGRAPPRYPGQMVSVASEHPGPLRVSVPEGPHEIMSSSDRDYVPNQSPAIKETPSDSENVV